MPLFLSISHSLTALQPFDRRAPRTGKITTPGWRWEANPSPSSAPSRSSPPPRCHDSSLPAAHTPPSAHPAIADPSERDGKGGPAANTALPCRLLTAAPYPSTSTLRRSPAAGGTGLPPPAAAGRQRARLGARPLRPAASRGSPQALRPRRAGRPPAIPLRAGGLSPLAEARGPPQPRLGPPPGRRPPSPPHQLVMSRKKAQPAGLSWKPSSR